MYYHTSDIQYMSCRRSMNPIPYNEKKYIRFIPVLKTYKMNPTSNLRFKFATEDQNNSCPILVGSSTENCSWAENINHEKIIRYLFRSAVEISLSFCASATEDEAQSFNVQQLFFTLTCLNSMALDFNLKEGGHGYLKNS